MIDEKLIEQVLLGLETDGYKCFSSEAQLRDTFAIKFRELYPNSIVIPEYTKKIPAGWGLSERRNLFFDLLIKDKENNELALVEFKYKTKRGEFRIHSDVDIILSDQSDTTNGRYAFWRDIYRIEHFINSNEISKGFMIFLTNNSGFYSSLASTNLDVNFSIEPGMHAAENKGWNKLGHSIASIQGIYLRDVQPLPIENDYYFTYKNYSTIKDNRGRSHTFYQLIVPVYSKKVSDDLERILRKMGKGVFVKYYDSFKTRDALLCKNAMGATYTPASLETRINCGISIFKDKRENEALRIIVSSSKVEESLRMEAQKKLDTNQ